MKLKAAGYKLPATKLAQHNNNNPLQPKQFTANNNSLAFSLPFQSYSSKSLNNSIEASINEFVESSCIAASESKWNVALERAKQAADCLKRITTTDLDRRKDGKSGNLFELTLMVNSNLAAQLKNCQQFRESIEMYTNLCRLATQSGSQNVKNFHFKAADLIGDRSNDEKRALLHRFGINIGNIYHQLGDYKRALKYYRITLDCLSSLPSGQMKQLQMKVMNNISLSLIEWKGFVSEEVLNSLNLLLADNLSRSPNQDQSSELLNELQLTACNANQHRFALNLIVCYYHRSELSNMMSTLRTLVKVNICHQYRRVFAETNSTAKGRRYLDEMKEVDLAGGSLTGEQADSTASYATRNGSSRLSEIRATAPINKDNLLLGARSSQTTTMTTNANKNTNDSIRLEAESIFRQLMSCCESDILEEIIVQKNEQVSRCLILTCNLMLELERRLNSSSSSVIDHCSELLLKGSKTYKSLVCNLNTNKANELIEGNQLDVAIEKLKDIEMIFLQQAGIEKDSSLSPLFTNKTTETFSNSVGSNLCLLYLLKDNLNRALEYGEFAISLSEANAHTYINLANCHFKMNNLQLARRLYEKGVKIDPTCWEANYNLALINRKLAGHFDDLLAETKSILISGEDDGKYLAGSKRRFILTLIQLALIYKQSDKIPSAIGILNDLIKSSKQAPEVHLMASRLLEESGKDSAKALTLLQQANREHPYHLTLLERLIALNINNFNYKSAKLLILECIKNRPDQVRWYQMLAECYRRDADYGRAMEIYKLAIETFAQDTSCLKALIKLSEELGLNEEKKVYEAKLEKIINTRNRF